MSNSLFDTVRQLRDSKTPPNPTNETSHYIESMNKSNSGHSANVWNILDKIISATVQFKHTITDPNKKNSRTITVKLSDYADSCGYTKDVHQKFFDVSNRVDFNRRSCLEKLGITFEDDKGGYARKKFTFPHTLPPPLLYHMFVLNEGVEAVPENDPPQGPQAENLPASPYVVDLKDKNDISFRVGNNRRVYWVHVPVSKGEATWNNFRHNLTVPMVKKMVTKLGGNQATGVQFLLRQLYKLDKHAVEAELSHLGIHTFKRLTPTETVALTVGSGISATARIFIGRFLRSQNHNKPVFACEKKCKKVKVQHVVPPVYDLYTYDEAKSKTCPDIVRRRVDYWKKDAWEVLMAELRNVRDDKVNNFNDIGVLQGELGKVIPVVVQGDSGGGEMKIALDMLLKETGKKNYCKQIASIEGKEDAHTLRNTVMNELNNSIERMQDSKMLVVKWANPVPGFDFVPLPERVAVANLNFNWIGVKEDTLHVTWDAGDIQGMATFERKDIPRLHEASILKIVPFSAGDLAYQFIILGRPGHAPSKCPYCKHCSKHWRAAPKHNGPLFSMDCIRKDRADLEDMARLVQEARITELGGPIPKDDDYYSIDTIIQNYIEATTTKEESVTIGGGVKGFRGLDVLLYSVLLEYWLVPPLHIMLGVGNYFIEKIKDFIETELEDAMNKDAPVSTAFFCMLGKDFNVVRQKYFTQTLVGNDVHRMLENSAALAANAKVIFKDVTKRKANVAPDIDVKIDSFTDKIGELMASFRTIYAYMSQTTQLSPAEINNFEILCKGFGLKWREYFEGCNFPPKLHLLETHAPKQMRKFGCLGDKMEAAVERLHHSVNKAKRIFAALPSYRSKHDAIMQRRDQAELEVVQQTIVKATNSTKRMFSPVVRVRKGQQSNIRMESKRTRIESSVHIAQTCLNFHNGL